MSGPVVDERLWSGLVRQASADGFDRVVAAAVVARPNGEILLLRRAAGDQFGGQWELPSGRVEAGEHLLQALRRELLEETGLETSAVGAWLGWFDYGSAAGVATRQHTFAVATPNGETVSLSDEHDAEAWVGISQAATMVSPEIRDVLTLWAGAAGPLPAGPGSSGSSGKVDRHIVALLAARAGADTIRRTVASGSLQVRTKSAPHDLLTAADEAADTAIVGILRQYYPDDSVVAEESGRHPGTGPVTWFVDPLDGTLNFVSVRDDYAVSVGSDGAGSERAAALFRPADGAWLATTARGMAGTFPAAVSMCPSARAALVSVGFPHSPQQRIKAMAVMPRILDAVRDFRRVGSAACELFAVATGRLDGYIGFELQPWDYSAGFTLVERAGGLAVELELPDGLRAFLAGAPAVVRELRELLSAT